MSYSRIMIISAILSTTLPALAAAEGREPPGQQIVWIFLSCCALIIIAQFVPLIINLKKQANVAKQHAKAAKEPQVH